MFGSFDPFRGKQVGDRGPLRAPGRSDESRTSGLGRPNLQRVRVLAKSDQSVLDAPAAWDSETTRARLGGIRDAATARAGAVRVFSLLAGFTDYPLRTSGEITRTAPARAEIGRAHV